MRSRVARRNKFIELERKLYREVSMKPRELILKSSSGIGYCARVTLGDNDVIDCGEVGWSRSSM